MNPSYLVDDNGNVHSREDIGSIVGSAPSTAEAVGFSVRQLGFIAVSERTTATILWLCPAEVTEVAFTTLALRLIERSNRIVLKWLRGDWRHEILPDSPSAIRRIAELINQASVDTKNKFLSKRRALNTLQCNHRLQLVIDMWRAEAFDHSRFTDALAEYAESRYILVGLGAKPGSLVFREVGRGVVFYGTDWQARTRGYRLQDQPDYELGLWVSQAYRDTLVSNTPRLDDTDIVVHRPRSEPIRITYTRLLLPLEEAGRPSGVLCVSHLDPGVDLRLDFKKVAEDVIN